MTAFRMTPAAFATAVFVALSAPAFAQDYGATQLGTAPDKPVSAQPVSYNGYSCDMVRAKVAESGVTAAYAYARYMGMSHRDISKVRKACAV